MATPRLAARLAAWTLLAPAWAWGAIDAPSPEAFQRLPDGKPSRYAVVVNGDAAEGPTFHTHRQQVQAMVRHLEEDYGVPRANITLLGEGSSAGSILGEASLSGLETAARRLRQTMDADDELFLYTTGHGDWEFLEGGGRRSFLTLEEGRVSASEFAKLFLELPAAKFVYYGDQCDGGGFARAMTARAKKNVVAVTATDEGMSHCYNFTPPYLRAFGRALKERVLKASAPPAEWEAFQAAKAWADEANSDHDHAEPNGLFLTSGKPFSR